jgi:hypothetical protein
MPFLPCLGLLLTLASDPRLRVSMHAPVVVIPHASRTPFLFCSGPGTMLCQAEFNAPPYHTKQKKVFAVRLGTTISRDGGATWQPYVLARQPHSDEVDLEGGAVQCADGTILLLDSYVMAGSQPNHGVGELWRSRDDFHTLEGPTWVDFCLPGIKFGSSSDDTGKPDESARLHRSIIALPNGDLLTLIYSWFTGDTAPAGYMAAMMKSRVVVVRSRDQGASWSYLATVGVDSGVGTEGFGEPVLVRIARGPHAGRLLCLCRTGRDLYGAHSDDAGLTWSRPLPVVFPGLDIRATKDWEKLFRDPQAPGFVPGDDMIGAVVDPDLIQMQNGVLVCTVGVRIPAKRYKEHWNTPRNGNYLAFSLDGGDTWSHLVQFRSGAATTQYMGVREVRPDLLFVVYDEVVRGQMPGDIKGFQMDVKRVDR